MGPLARLGIVLMAGVATAPAKTKVPESSTVYFVVAERKDESLVIRALDAWMRSVPVSFILETGTCDMSHPRTGRICVRIENRSLYEWDELFVGHMDGSIGFTLGTGNFDGGDVYVLDSGPEPLQTLEHEIGHAMGLEHDRVGTLMCPVIDQTRAPTCLDIAQWYRVRGMRGPDCR